MFAERGVPWICSHELSGQILLFLTFGLNTGFIPWKVILWSKRLLNTWFIPCICFHELSGQFILFVLAIRWIWARFVDPFLLSWPKNCAFTFWSCSFFRTWHFSSLLSPPKYYRQDCFWIVTPCIFCFVLFFQRKREIFESWNFAKYACTVQVSFCCCFCGTDSHLYS